MADISIKEITRKIEELPTPDFIVQRIVSIASSPNASTKELNMAILESPSMAAKILKMANSAYYAMPRRITKLSQAINILGFRSVRNLALSVFTAKSFFSREFEYFNTKKVWSHFMATAISCELLSKFINFPDREEAFLCGMLHDLGKMAMSIVMPDVFEMIVTVAKHKKISFSKAEELLETYSHQQIGRMLFENWQMSEIMIASATFHDSPSLCKSEDSRTIVNLVSIANTTVNILLYGYSGCFDIPAVSDEAWNNLGLTPRKYLNYFENLKIKIKESEDFMNLSNVLDDLQEGELDGTV
ncbi:MAG TPA: HDOD domain-containing protein [Petrotogaceae bacterium]|nr:HDOD domain-containing protein [Petrotogaceae bacterium]HQH33690.1 HDOD domain-containing protein [Petrotogaceae bacterium]